jgi:hypothetical protein
MQLSTWGEAIPIVYGSSRLAGNVIYMQDINQTVTRSKHRQDGQRYYEITSTYTSTFAVAFCDGPVEGIARIWLNKKVFADFRDPAGPYYPTGSITYAATNFETSIELEAIYFTIYTGTETQTADPDIVAILGAAETPAYRGICYVVFKDFPIGEFSGLPKIEVEIGPQMSATDCSEYWIGTDGESLPSDIFSEISHTGASATIKDNSANFVGVGEWAYSVVYEFTGEFDVYFEFSLNSYDSVITSGSFYLSIGGSTGFSFNWPSFYGARYYEVSSVSVYNYVETTAMAGKLRIRRDSENNIIVYYWNATLSRWEWNGDTNGIITEQFVHSFRVYFYIDMDDASMDFSILDYVVTSGCDNTVWDE